jgi:hypothetical protein
MSWDGKALLILTLIWAAISLIYATVIGMAPGARAWGAGALIFAFLTWTVRRMERQGATRRS